MGLAETAAYFAKIGRADLRILEFPVSAATVDLAAVAVGVEPDRIAKTMSFKLKDRCILIVMSGRSRTSNRKFKDTFHCKATMLKADEALDLTGHPVGGVCPFGLKTPLEVYLDLSLRKYDYVYPSAGAVNSAVRIRVDEFDKIVPAQWVDVCE